MHSTLFLPTTFQQTATVLLAIIPFISATPSSSQLEPHAYALFPKGWVSLGCYSDNPTRRTLTSKFLTTLNFDMRIWICTSYCNDLNKSYAGLENGTECFCGNILTDGATKIPDSDCLIPCIGDSSQYCGGTDSLSLYSANGAPFQAPPTMPPYVDSWKLMGCYDDSDLSTLKHPVTPVVGYYNNSADHCIATCASWKYSVAGMKSAGECWCDNAINERKEPIDPKSCMLACPANSLEICGGPNSTTVYASILP